MILFPALETRNQNLSNLLLCCKGLFAVPAAGISVRQEPPRQLKKENHAMNIGYLILIIFGGSIGLLSTLYIIVSLFATIGYKIYRKIKYGMSLYD